MVVWLIRHRLALLILAISTAGCAGQLQGDLEQTRQLLHQTQEELRTLKEQHQQQRLRNDELLRQLKRIKMVQEVAQRVSRLRGLPLIQPLKVRNITDSGFIKRFLRAEFYREYTPAYIEAYTASLVKVGLYPEGMDLFTTMQELLAEQWAGFYHPPQKTFFIRPGVPMLEMILSHEITHALQDQSYDLEALINARKGNDDGTFALQALVEGDALSTMATFAARSISLRNVLSTFTDLLGMLAMDQQKLLAAPPYVREPMLRMYTDGMEFVQALSRERGAQAVDEAFGDPPRTSEQILHPDKYLRRELPRLTALPAIQALGGGWREIHENTLGEIGVQILLGGQGRWRARAAADGWDGDRLRGYRHPEKGVMIVWLTRWDTREDADEFAETLKMHLDERYGRGGEGWRSPGGMATVQRGRNEVLLLDGALSCAQVGFIGAQLKMTAATPCKPVG